MGGGLGEVQISSGLPARVCRQVFADSADKFADRADKFADTLRTLWTKLQTPRGHRADSVRTVDTIFLVAGRYSVSKRYGTYVCIIFLSHA
jgi:hypothetical protein